MSVNTCDDIVSVDDVIDLNRPFDHEDGRYTSMSTNKPNHYRISLHSIDDDELRIFHRDLVTPVPSVCCDDDIISRNMVRQRYPMPARPASRTESVMLFKKINNGDEDVSSFDLVSSDLRDFLDTDFMMDSILSRPVSRTTISKNASKIQDINKFRNTLQKRNDLLPKKKETPPFRMAPKEPLKDINKIRTREPIKEEPFRRYNTYSYITPPKTYNKKQPETLRPKKFTKSFVHEPVSEPKQLEPKIPEPRLNRKQTFSTRHRDRMRSETVSSSSSSEEEEFWMQRSSQLLKNIKNDQAIETSGRLKPKAIIQEQQNYTTPLGHYSSPILHHRYSVPNNRFFSTAEQHAIEHKSLSSSRLKSHYTKTNEVTDSAKHVLACIRERRKSALVLESPKVETRTRFSSQDTCLVSDFRARLQLHRESALNRRSQPSKYVPSIRRYEDTTNRYI